MCKINNKRIFFIIILCQYLLPVLNFRGQRLWRKRGKRWDACVVKEKKSYSFISELMDEALRRRIEAPDLLRKKVSLEEADPRRIMPVLADVPPPPTAELLKKRESRMWASYLWQAWECTSLSRNSLSFFLIKDFCNFVLLCPFLKPFVQFHTYCQAPPGCFVLLLFLIEIKVHYSHACYEGKWCVYWTKQPHCQKLTEHYCYCISVLKKVLCCTAKGVTTGCILPIGYSVL